jgi:hypothetical protein
MNTPISTSMGFPIDAYVFGRTCLILKESRDKTAWMVVYTDQLPRGRKRTHGMTTHKINKLLVTSTKPAPCEAG